MVQDIPKLYTALAEWLACVIILFIHKDRIKKENLVKIFSVLICAMALLDVVQLFCGTVEGVAWILGMAIAISIMFLILLICLGMNYLEAIYYTASAFIWAEFAAALEWQIESFYSYRFNDSKLYSILVCCVIYSFSFGIFYLVERIAWKNALEGVDATISSGDIFRVWVAVIVFFTLSNLSYVKIQSPFSGSSLQEIFNIRTLVDLAGIIMIELFHIQKAENDGRRELDSIKQTLYLQYMQYRQSSENMEMINQKYHDLKHQIQVIRAEKDNYKRIGYIDELEKNIGFYDSAIETGNYVLDTILTDKSRQCLKQDINMTVVADGRLLNYMHVMDIATIFGNALDNAIEHEVLISDKSMRMIHVTVSRHEELIHVIIENKFSGELRSEGNRILTTKPDQQNHGYGLKSIQYTIEKYDGFMAAGVEEGWFRLKLMLPVK